jgi:hypothetical protein
MKAVITITPTTSERELTVTVEFDPPTRKDVHTITEHMVCVALCAMAAELKGGDGK